MKYYKTSNANQLCCELLSVYLALVPPQLPGEEGGGDGGAEADGAEDAEGGEGAALYTGTETDGCHRGAGTTAAAGHHQQLCPAAAATGAA